MAVQHSFHHLRLEQLDHERRLSAGSVVELGTIRSEADLRSAGAAPDGNIRVFTDSSSKVDKLGRLPASLGHRLDVQYGLSGAGY